ncbi:MAG: hypothetical protein Q8P67_02785 [archaeon]|nr:hypothetical protein [archaeon]
MSLADFRTELEPNDVEQIGDFLAAKITEMIALAAESSFEGEAGPSLSAAPMLPLIRLCVNYSGGFQTVHPSRFGQRFVGKVANPDSLLRFTRQSVRNLDRPTLDLEREQEILRDFAQHAGANNGDRQDEQAIGHLIQSFLSSGMRPLQALAVDELTTALTDFVDKGDNAAFSAFLSHTVKATCDHLNGLDPMSTMTEGDITSLIIERTQKLNISGADCHLDGEESDECCRSPPHSPIDPASLAGVSLQEASLQEPASHPQRANPFENRTSNKLPAPKRSSPSRPRGATQSARSKRASSGDGLTNSGPLGDTRVPIKRQRKGTPGLTTTMTPTRLNPAITISLDSDDDDSSSPAPQSSWLPKAASATTKSSTYGSSSIGAEDVTPMVPIPIPGRARNWGIRPVDR